MSTALAYSLPETAPTSTPELAPRHIRIVASPTQRRARPKVLYALLTIGGLFALFIAQLLLSIAVSDGAYQISSLNSQERQLEREKLALEEDVNLLSSPQNLATRAESLGMVLSRTTPVFVQLADGAIVGSQGNAVEGSALMGPAGSLVPNSLMSELPVSPNASAAVLTAGTLPNTPAASLASSNITPIVDSIPAPVTR
jgi:cell division protein FtsL